MRYMDRKKFLMRKRFRYILILFVTFMAIMLIFSFIVYAVAESALYEEVDTQMTDADMIITDNKDNSIENISNGSNIVYTDKGSYVINYKIFLLLRNQEGEILNAEYLTSFDYMLHLDFSPANNGKFNTEKVERNNEIIYYHTFTRSIEAEDGQKYYIQMATDSTEIELSLTIILNVLARCTLFAMLLVIVVGWYLSKVLVGGVEEAWERQDEFISYASHELRSPLTVIHSSLELLLESPGKKIIERSELITNSLTETSRLRKMSSNLLAMVQLQASEMTIKPELIDIEEMIEDFIEPFTYQAEAADKHLTYWLQPGMTLNADRQLLTELFVILLENALKYTEPGDGIRVIAQEDDGKFDFIVSDSGIGLGLDNPEKVFDRFFRDERHQSKSDGSGLGLYIARLIVSSHGGTIKAEDNKPKGTVFRVSIPLKRKFHTNKKR